MPVSPHIAASLILYKKSDDQNIHLLMGQRNKNLRFMPGFLVFPGGKVEDEDFHLAQDLFQKNNISNQENAFTSLDQLALLVTAIRESQEETGVSLRNDLSKIKSSFSCIARAITPEFSPVRFDTYFFLCDAEHFSEPKNISGELENIQWFNMNQMSNLPIADVTEFVITKVNDSLSLKSKLPSRPSLLTYASNSGRIIITENDKTGIF